MNLMDFVLTALIVGASALAVRSIHKRRKKGGCCGDCSSCTGCK